MFQITDGRMEILVARLDFSLVDCRGAGPRGSSQKALCEAEHRPPPPPNLQEISREERSDAPGATLTWGILWSSDYADWTDFTKVIDPPSASGPVSPSLWLRLTVQSLAAGWRKLPDKCAGNRREDTIWSFIYKYFSSTYWPQLRGKKKPLISRLELNIPKGDSLHNVICFHVCRRTVRSASGLWFYCRGIKSKCFGVFLQNNSGVSNQGHELGFNKKTDLFT